jgi:hypothetical protein
MLGRAKFVNLTSKRLPAKPAFTIQKLQRLALWGSAAAAALFIAALAGRSDVGSQRVAAVLSSLHLRAPHPNQAAGPLDMESTTRQLVQTVRGLTEDRDRLMMRLAAVEHNLDDVTGSVTRQIEAAKDQTSPWPKDAPPEPATPAAIASVVAPLVPPAGLASSLAPSPLAAAAEATPGAAPPTAYGVDLGSAHSLQALHARWVAFRTARPKLFEGLKPLVALKEVGRSKRVELRLVVGPLPGVEAAARLCASLASFELYCQPTAFEGQRLALR